jgi:2-(1,2-epoxy-1,2-dihydrophenyl)acetyl-CoA isomerase
MTAPHSPLDQSPELDVRVEQRGSTVVARLARPERGNSIHGTLMHDLIRALESADRDDAVRAVITTGAGATFCAGADRDLITRMSGEGRIDFHEHGYQGVLGGEWDMPELSSEQRRGDPLGWGRWVTRFLDVGTPLIAAINGGAAGGGLALALLHDIRIAGRTAKLVPAFVHLGASPELGISWLLPRMVGLPRAFDLITRSRPIEADEALELGLVEAVVEPAELLDAALARAEEFAQLSPLSVRATKRLLRQATESTLETQLEREWNMQTRLFGFPETGARMSKIIGRP